LVASLIWKFATLPPFFELFLLAGVAGSFTVALTAFARLTFQFLYRMF
jgi:hypothetical protein